MSYYLVIVGTLDNPLYETYLTSTKSSTSTIISVPPTSTSSSSSSPQSSSSHPITTTTTTAFSILGGQPILSSSSANFSPGKSPTSNLHSLNNNNNNNNNNNTTGIGYGSKSGPNSKHVMQFIAHASLDVLEDLAWSTGSGSGGGGGGLMYFKQFDRFHEWSVSGWITPGGVRFVLLHEVKNEEGIKLFLMDCWESYVKTLMNPFHDLNSRIRSQTFDDRIKASSRKHL